MEYINHYTLNTGDNRKSYPTEINPGINSSMDKMIAEFQNEGIALVLDDVYIRLDMYKYGSYVAILEKKVNNTFTPFLITGGCYSREEAPLLIRELSEVYETVYKKKVKIVPITPFCIDIVLPTSLIALDALSWTGDFCRCLAWKLLDPDAISEK